MKASRSVWWIIAIALLMVATGLLFAQEAETPEHGNLITVSSSGDRAWMGVRLSDVTPAQASQLKLPAGGEGALITEVEKGSPSAKAGLEVNDVVQSFDGERVRSAAELRRLVRETPAGRAVSVEISRDGHRHKFNLTLEARPQFEGLDMPPFQLDMPAMTVPEIRIPSFNFDWHWGPSRLGITGDDLTPQLAKYFGVGEGKGVLITSVAKGSPAEKAGLEAGDCIVKVDTTAVGSVWELRRALSENSRDKREVSLSIVRSHATQQVKVELDTEWHEPVLSARDSQESRDLARELAKLRQKLTSDQSELQQLQQEMQGDAARRALAELRRNAEEVRHQTEQQRQNLEREIRDQQRQLRDQFRELERVHTTI